MLGQRKNSTLLLDIDYKIRGESSISEYSSKTKAKNICEWQDQHKLIIAHTKTEIKIYGVHHLNYFLTTIFDVSLKDSEKLYFQFWEFS